MKSLFSQFSLYFAPEQRRDTIQEQSWAKELQAVDLLIQKAKKLHEQWLQQAKNANATVLSDRSFRRSNEFKSVLIEIQKLNTADAKKIDDMLWQEINSIESVTRSIQEKYKSRTGEINYEKLWNDKAYQEANAKKMLLHEMRGVHQKERIQLNVEAAEKKKNIVTKTQGELVTLDNQINGRVKAERSVGTDAEINSLKENILKGDKQAVQKLAAILISDLDNASALFGGRSEAKNKIHIFSENGQKFAVGELQLFKIFQNQPSLFKSFLEQNNFNLERELFARDGNINEIMQKSVKPLQEKILSRVGSLSELQQLVTGKSENQSVDVGIVLSGREQEYVNELFRNQENLKKLEDTRQDKTSVLEKIASLVASLGVSLAFPGAYVRYENRELKPGENGHPLALKIGEWAQNITAKLGLLSATLQWNWNDKESRILNETSNFSKKLNALQGQKPLTMEMLEKIDPIFKNNENVKTYLQHSEAFDFKGFLDVMSYQKLVELAKKEEGWWLKWVEATIALPSAQLNVGLSWQKISTEYLSTDGKVAQEVMKQVWYEKSESVQVKEIPGEPTKYEYTLKNIDGLKWLIEKTTGEKITFQTKENGLVSFVSETPLNIVSHNDIQNDGSQKISYKVEKVVPQDISLSSNLEGASNLERQQAGTQLANKIYQLNRGDKNFDRNIIMSINQGNYEKAFNALQKNYPEIARLVTDKNGKPNNDAMNVLLTYTYGTRGVKNANGTISENLYKNSRTQSVLQAESQVASRLAWENISPNEKVFEGHKMTPTQLSKLFPDQPLAASVVATPKNGTHRLDNFYQSLDVSNVTAEISSDKLKQGLIQAYGTEIDKQLTLMNFALQTNISKEQYINMLLGKEQPSSVLKGLKFQKNPQFFETRAMLHGNICNNLTYGLAFPTFTYNGVKQNPEVNSSLGSLSMAAQINVTEAAAGVAIPTKKPKREEEKKEEPSDPKTEPKPDPQPNTPPTPPETPNIPNTPTPNIPNTPTPNIPDIPSIPHNMASNPGGEILSTVSTEPLWRIVDGNMSFEAVVDTTIPSDSVELSFDGL